MSESAIAQLVRRAGDAAVWPGLYAGGVLWLLAWLIGSEPERSRMLIATAFVVLCSQAGYLLDRVKTRASLLDPADLAAQPERARFVRMHQRAIRVWIVLELGGASVLAWRLHPLLAAVPLGTGIGVMAYAGRPAGQRRSRPKDWPMVKGVWIAAAHAALGSAALLAANRGTDLDRTRWVIATAAVGLIVLGDAMLCDLDDQNADRRFGTRSVPVMLGERATWLFTAACVGGASVCTLWLLPWTGAVLLAALLIGGHAVAYRLGQRRDFIDARLGLIAALCVLLV